MKTNFTEKIQKFIEYTSGLSSYISIVGVGLILVGRSITATSFADVFPDPILAKKIIDVTCLILGFVLIIFPIIIVVLHDRIKLWILKKRKLSSFIIEKQDIVIDISKSGRVATYYEKLIFHKVGKNNNNHYLTKVEVSGQIESDSIYSQNCFYNLSSDKKHLSVSYTNHSDQLNKYVNIVGRQNKFLIFTAVFKDTFIKKTESWDLIPINYCIQYSLRILIPKGAKLKYARLFRIKNGQEEEIHNINPVIINTNKRQQILLQICDYDYGELLRLRWNIH